MSTLVATKLPRPLQSGSALFEAGYLKFLDYVFEHKPVSVSREETPEYRAIVLAGCVRIVCSKKTGLLRSERCSFGIALPGQAATKKWSRSANFPVDHFWVLRGDLARAVLRAWEQQVARFIPAAETCFPDGIPSKFEEYAMTKENLRNMYIGLAAERRLAKRVVRGQAVSVFIGALWNFLVDRDTLKLCHAYFGRKASFQDYNLTVRFKQELIAREAETPALTALMGLYIKGSQHLFLPKHQLGQDLVAASRRYLFGAPGGLAIAQVGPTGFVRDTQNFLVQPEELAPASWRFLANQTRFTVGSLINFIQRMAEGYDTPCEAAALFSARLNLLVRTGEVLPFSFLKWALERISYLGNAGKDVETRNADIENLVRFLRLAARQAQLERRRGTLKHFLKSDLVLAWDWLAPRDNRLRRRETPPLTVVAKGMTWSTIMRAQRAWHAQREAREQARREADKLAYEAFLARQAEKTWDSALGAMDILGVRVEPLLTGKLLQEEGARMSHCVADYVDVCVKGQSRIFSLQDGDAFATLELSLRNGRDWVVAQVFGYDNADVSERIERVAREVATRYQQCRPRRKLKAAA